MGGDRPEPMEIVSSIEETDAVTPQPARFTAFRERMARWADAAPAPHPPTVPGDRRLG